MRVLRGQSLQRELFRSRSFCIVLIVCLACVRGAFGQEQTNSSAQNTSTPQDHMHSETVSSLQDLLTEAEQNNPKIKAAQQEWQAAKQVPSQVSTLPDPQLNV